jgi:tetratricopeptide (TPR) repeat protein
MISYRKTLFVITLLLSIQASNPAFAHAPLADLIEYTTSLLASKPGDSRALLNRARLRLKQGDASNALNDIEAAERFSDQIDVAFVRGLYFVAESQYENAIREFSRYLARYPAYTPAIHARAKAYAKRNLVEPAIRDYQYLLSVSKVPSPDYYLELARLESTLQPHGLHQSLRTLDRGIERLGTLVSLQMEAIKVEILRKDYPAALARHESLEPWLGKTQQWKLRKQELSDKLLVAVESS